MRRALCLFLLPALLVTAAAAQDRAEKKGDDKKSEAAAIRKELKLAQKLLKARRIDQGVARLESVLEKFPESSAAAGVRKTLRAYGVGDEVRVRLRERGVLRKRFKLTEKKLLDLEEKVLEELRAHYRGVEPFFRERQLELVLYDSQASFRKAGGAVTMTGHFRSTLTDTKKRRTRGKIEWHYPLWASSFTDRQTSMKSVLYHESTHYLNSVYFARLVPPVLDEGLAVYLTSRLNKTHYQHFRTTDRLLFESHARHGLGAIAKYEDFLSFVGRDERGLGRGDASVNRWYGLCYAVVDLLAHGRVSRRKASLGELLEKFAKLAEKASKAEGGSETEPPPRRDSRDLLEELVRDLYDANLRQFHATLVQRIQRSYKPI